MFGVAGVAGSLVDSLVGAVGAALFIYVVNGLIKRHQENQAAAIEDAKEHEHLDTTRQQKLDQVWTIVVAGREASGWEPGIVPLTDRMKAVEESLASVGTDVSTVLGLAQKLVKSGGETNSVSDAGLLHAIAAKLGIEVQG